MKEYSTRVGGLASRRRRALMFYETLAMLLAEAVSCRERAGQWRPRAATAAPLVRKAAVGEPQSIADQIEQQAVEQQDAAAREEVVEALEQLEAVEQAQPAEDIPAMTPSTAAEDLPATGDTAPAGAADDLPQ